MTLLTRNPGMWLRGAVALAAVLVVCVAPAEARRRMGETELDETNAAGQGTAPLTISRADLDLDVTAPLVVNQVVGDNQVLTEVRLTLATTPGDVAQQVTLAQDRDGQGVAAVAGPLALKIGTTEQRELMAAVVNNVLGANQLATTVNVQLLLAPLTLGVGAVAGLGSPGDARTDTTVSGGGSGSVLPPQGVTGDVLRIGTATYAWPPTADQLPKIYDAAVSQVPSLATDADFLRALGRSPTSSVPVKLPSTQPGK